MTEIKDRDEFTGIETTGHSWDGIKELNNPLPRWWLYILYATIIWAIGYWIAMPAWPMISSYTKGVLGYSSRAGAQASIEAAVEAQSEFRTGISAAELPEIVASPELLEFALAGGRSAFGDNCAPCHGSGAAGARGYPNLNDDDWLWGGTLDDIMTSVRYGIRSAHEETRQSAMPAFGTDGILSRTEISALADYLLSLSDQSEQEIPESTLTLFQDNCAACHGEDARGLTELGAPNLANALWLYGGERADIFESISRARAGVMPHWEGRLDEVTIKQLVVYVHSLGGGQ